MAADLLGLPFIALEKSEAEQLSDAAQDIFGLYDMAVPPSVAAWLKLAGVCSMVYGPRVMMYSQFRREQARASEAVRSETLQ